VWRPYSQAAGFLQAVFCDFSGAIHSIDWWRENASQSAITLEYQTVTLAQPPRAKTGSGDHIILEMSG
jgi:hypothetical protein